MSYLYILDKNILDAILYFYLGTNGLAFLKGYPALGHENTQHSLLMDIKFISSLWPDPQCSDHSCT